MPKIPLTHQEPHTGAIASKLNALRAAVLGANDGIVSTAGLVVGVAGADAKPSTLLLVGIAGVVAGALSMAAGEYISVSSQRDSEKSLLDKERQELHDYPKEELKELTELYKQKGLTGPTAKLVAAELTKKDAFAAHTDIELNINPADLNNPWQAAVASALSFLAGSIIPLFAVVFSQGSWHVPITFMAVIVALIITGTLSAIASDAKKLPTVGRVVLWGAGAMIITYLAGRIVGSLAP